MEGNDYLRKRRPYDAIRLLEPLAHEVPDDWQAHMALGAAYLQTKQYEPAVAVLERALPTWQRFPERRGNVVPNLLARAYVGLRRIVDATRVLRNAGVPENEIPTRLKLLAQANQ
jgi:predicted Zn-dependent protease